MGVNQEIVPEPEPDYADNLQPGYRFCPTDSELIVHYLKPKIDGRRHPPCRIHEVYLYDYNPQELAERYRVSENNWYFLTSRQRIYAKGDRPNRVTKDKGYWKTTQKQKTVYDDVSRQAVGSKRNLAYFDKNKGKTMWLMNEYTTNDPNLPFGSGENGNKLNDWVLCKMYKKETNQATDNNAAEKVHNTRSQGEEADQPQKRLHDELPSPRRRQRVSINQDNNAEMVDPVSFTFNTNQQAADYFDTRVCLTGLTGYADQSCPAPESSVNHNDGIGRLRNSHSSLYPTTVQRRMVSFQGSPPVPLRVQEPQNPDQVFGERPFSWNSTCGQNQSSWAATNGFQFSNNGGSSSASAAEMEPQPPHFDGYTKVQGATNLGTSRDLVQQQHEHEVQNHCDETLLTEQNGSN